jgi:flagellar motor switch protein FliN
VPEETAQSTPGASDQRAAEDTGNVPLTGDFSAAPLLMGVRLPIRVLLGRTQLSLRAITQLANGAVVELDCSPNDPVQIMVHDRVIAYGEVVVVAGNYGVRVTKIATREDSVVQPSVDSALLNLSEKLR